jgi:predicted nucleic acid-binding protein
MSVPSVYLDTNIFLRHIRNDHPTWSPACRRVFTEIEEGRLHGWTSELAIAEIVFILESKKHYNQPRSANATALLPLLALPKLTLPHKKLYRRMFAVYTNRPKLSYVDCYTAVIVEANKRGHALLSYDTDFDELKTITRKEPALGEDAKKQAA